MAIRLAVSLGVRTDGEPDGWISGEGKSVQVVKKQFTQWLRVDKSLGFEAFKREATEKLSHGLLNSSHVIQVTLEGAVADSISIFESNDHVCMWCDSHDVIPLVQRHKEATASACETASVGSADRYSSKASTDGQNSFKQKLTDTWSKAAFGAGWGAPAPTSFPDSVGSPPSSTTSEERRVPLAGPDRSPSHEEARERDVGSRVERRKHSTKREVSDYGHRSSDILIDDHSIDRLGGRAENSRSRRRHVDVKDRSRRKHRTKKQRRRDASTSSESSEAGTSSDDCAAKEKRRRKHDRRGRKRYPGDSDESSADDLHSGKRKEKRRHSRRRADARGSRQESRERNEDNRRGARRGKSAEGGLGKSEDERKASMRHDQKREHRRAASGKQAVNEESPVVELSVRTPPEAESPQDQSSDERDKHHASVPWVSAGGRGTSFDPHSVNYHEKDEGECRLRVPSSMHSPSPSPERAADRKHSISQKSGGGDPLTQTEFRARNFGWFSGDEEFSDGRSSPECSKSSIFLYGGTGCPTPSQPHWCHTILRKVKHDVGTIRVEVVRNELSEVKPRIADKICCLVECPELFVVACLKAGASAEDRSNLYKFLQANPNCLTRIGLRFSPIPRHKYDKIISDASRDNSQCAWGGKGDSSRVKEPETSREDRRRGDSIDFELREGEDKRNWSRRGEDGRTDTHQTRWSDYSMAPAREKFSAMQGNGNQSNLRSARSTAGGAPGPGCTAPERRHEDHVVMRSNGEPPTAEWLRKTAREHGLLSQPTTEDICCVLPRPHNYVVVCFKSAVARRDFFSRMSSFDAHLAPLYFCSLSREMFRKVVLYTPPA